MADDNSWKTSNFRQSVVNKINEAIQQSGLTSSKNGLEMENHVFTKARTKDEYLGYVARLILHVREMNSKKNPQNVAGSNQDGGNPGQQGGMPDPINALQTLASQGTRPQMMGGQMGPGGPMGGQMGAGNASNLLQTLNRPQMPMTGAMAGMQGANRVGMGGPNQMGGMMSGQPGMPNQMGGVMGPGGMSGGKIVGIGNQNQMGQMNPMQMQNQMGGTGMQQGQQQPGQQQGSGPGGSNQINPMSAMGGMQMNPGAQMNQNALSQQLNSAGMNQGPGQMTGGSPMDNMGVNPNQVIRQQLPPGMNPNQQQMGMAAGQMNQMNSGVAGPGGNMTQIQQQAVAQQQAQAGIGNMGPGNLQQQSNQQQQAQGVSNVGPGQINATGMGPGGNIPGNQMGGSQANFVPIGANSMIRKPQDMMSGGQVYPGGAVRSVTPNQFLRQSPSPSVPSPVGPGSMGPQSHPGQMIPSPALIPSPSPQMGSVPPRNIGQSPGSTLNTPGQPGGAAPSPLNPQDEQLYREKYRSLTKYIEPLKRMIARMENDDVDKIGKLKRLLEILCNPTRRIPLETLYKCEAALTSQLGSMRETPLNNPLVEAVSANLQSSLGNHTLQRTFRPCLEALFGPDIKNLPTPAKQPRLAIEESLGSSSGGTQEIPHILQGEIARLDQKFKVSLDQCAVGGTKTIKLICWLDDKHLPCVPPVAVTIPEDYPFISPSCTLIEQEYNATPFLIQVQKSFLARICKLPEMFSLSHLLDSWEMSVRQACAPNPSQVAPSATSVLLGM